MHGTWEQLIGNLAFVSLVFSMWAHISVWFRRWSAEYEKFLLGLLGAATAIGSMALSVEFSPGVYVDLRYAPVAVAGLFGGPIAALLAGVAAIGFRVQIGGAAATEGAIVIAAACCIGLLVNLRRRKRSPTLPDLALLVVGLGAVLVVAMTTLPTLAKLHALAAVGLPMLVLNGAAVAATGFILLKTQQYELERNILVAAFSQSPDYLYIKDRESRFVTVNENMASLYHFGSTADMRGLTDFDVITRQVAEELYYREQEAIRTGEPLVNSFEHIAGRYYLASKVPLRDGQGNIIGLAGVSRDVTERVELERELRESKNLLSHAMAGMSDGFAMFDSKGYLLFCNDQYREAFPLTADARVVGAHITDILRRVAETRERTDLPSDDLAKWVETAGASLHRNKDEEIQFCNGDWRSLKTRLAEDGTAMVVVSDITAMKQAEVALKLSAEQLRNLADTDGLTGMVNRRAFDEAFSREASRSARNDTPLSLLMIDIDRFKAYNDTYGHPAGDDCLRRVSRCLLKSVKRPADIVARYGGEEFVVLLPETDAGGAAIVAEQFARLLEKESIPHSGSEFGRVTASVGLSSAKGRILRSQSGSLLSTADEALYEAKAAGRNRTVVRDFAEMQSTARGIGKLRAG